MTIEIVSFPIENGGSFHSYVTVYQRVAYLRRKVDMLIGMPSTFPLLIGYKIQSY